MNRNYGRPEAIITAALAGFCLVAPFMGGCAGTTANAVPRAKLQAIQHNQRGVAEEAQGNADAALEEFSEALRLNASMENRNGMAIALINIARTNRLKGDIAAARAAMERASALSPLDADLAAELNFEKAKVFLAAGDMATARKLAGQAAGEEKGEYPGRRLNLVAMIALRQGDVNEARALAEKALKINRDEDSTGEIANSLRLLGEVYVAQGDNGQAVKCYTEALALDKELGAGNKIASDLRSLAALSEKTGDVAGAIGYLRRAVEVSLNSGYMKAAAKDMASLAALYRQNGQPLLADRIDSERNGLQKRSKE